MEVILEGWLKVSVEGSGEMVEGRSSTLKQTKGVFVEGGVNDIVDPEELGVELFRELGLREGCGLTLERRHLAEGGKGVWGKEDEKRRLEATKTELTLTHGGFYLGLPKGVPQT